MTISLTDASPSSPARAMAWTRACAGAGEPRRESRSQRFRRGARRHRRSLTPAESVVEEIRKAGGVAMADAPHRAHHVVVGPVRQFRPGQLRRGESGMIGLMNVLAEEGRKNNIRVNTISPTAGRG